jgi:hypothetical protein
VLRLNPFACEFQSSDLETIRLLGGDSFSPFSYHSLSAILESGDILPQVAFLPNESYAGRVPNTITRMNLTDQHAYPPGFLRPGTFWSIYPASRDGCSSSPATGAGPRAYRKPASPRAASRTRERFEKGR